MGVDVVVGPHEERDQGLPGAARVLGLRADALAIRACALGRLTACVADIHLDEIVEIVAAVLARQHVRDRVDEAHARCPHFWGGIRGVVLGHDVERRPRPGAEDAGVCRGAGERALAQGAGRDVLSRVAAGERAIAVVRRGGDHQAAPATTGSWRACGVGARGVVAAHALVVGSTRVVAALLIRVSRRLWYLARAPDDVVEASIEGAVLPPGILNSPPLAAGVGVVVDVVVRPHVEGYKAIPAFAGLVWRLASVLALRAHAVPKHSWAAVVLLVQLYKLGEVVAAMRARE
mmetsp:Transcript_87182/g.241765  ORF Transcript_87182/g.241765 Transcript_87182/m.241765 type:complete len:290 (-) Transcript_87182:413-1282(-)